VKKRQMPIITLRTEIQAPIAICFDLSRSIRVHIYTARHTGERAVAGVQSGLIGPGESVTWRAKHFWWHEMTTEIREFDPPTFFRDSAVAGYFERFDHEHRFERGDGDTTVMTDRVDFRSRLGPIGAVADALFVRWYLQRFLTRRNRLIKKIAEDPARRYSFLRSDPGHAP
jgi:hypothetical protein